MGVDLSDAKDLPSDLEEKTVNGERLMRNAADKANPIISPETVKDDDGGGGGGQKSFDQVMASSQKNMNVVDRVIAQGGFSGPDKDKYDIRKAYSEWVKARNELINCPDQITKTSVRYTTLVNGKAGQNEIIKAHQDHLKIKELCDKSVDRINETAKKYIEVDRRVRENHLKEQNIYPIETMTMNIERFQTRGGSGRGVIEGFNYYNVNDSYIANPAPPGTFNQRLPRFKQTNTTISDTTKSTLPWNQYYTVCGGEIFCEKAHNEKDSYILSINTLFDKAEEKLKLYQYVIQLKNTNMGSAESKNTLNRLLDENNGALVNTAIENQKNDIAIYKQQALYDYDEYNSLSFTEELINFIYYAVFTMVVVFSLRQIYSSYGGYDKRNIIILILLGIYPKYILKVVLWLLNILTEIMRMLGLKNVSFWW